MLCVLFNNSNGHRLHFYLYINTFFKKGTNNKRGWLSFEKIQVCITLGYSVNSAKDLKYPKICFPPKKKSV